MFLVEVGNLKLKIEVEVSSWTLKLKFEIEVWSWSLKLKLKVKAWSGNLKFADEVRVVNWSQPPRTLWPFYKIWKSFE